MKSTIQKGSNHYNPYLVNGHYINSIKFFKNGEVIASTNSGWLTPCNNDAPRIDFDFEIKNKRKIDLNAKHGFVVKSRGRHGEEHQLYLPLDLIEHELLGEAIDSETDTYTSFMSRLRVNVVCVLTKHRLDKGGELEYYETELAMHEIDIRYGYRRADTPLGKKCKKLAELFKAQNVEITSYDVERMLKVTNITIKRKQEVK